MRTPIALSLPIPSLDMHSSLQLARKAESWGYTACWNSEVQGPDAFSTLGALSVATDMDLGVAIIPVQTRSAFVLGMSAMSVAELSGGRFTLGLGPSSEVIVSQWAGLKYEKPLAQVRETVEALKPLLAGERTDYVGHHVRIGNYKPHTAPPGGRIPLVLGALGPRACRMVGELQVDGICLNQLAPENVPQILSQVAEGAEGNLPDEFQVIVRLFCAITNDRAAMFHHVKWRFAPYIATRGYNSFYRWMGYEKEADGILGAAGDRSGMASSVSDRLVEDIFCIGARDHVIGKIHDFLQQGVTLPVIEAISPDQTEAENTLWEIASAFS